MKWPERTDLAVADQPGARLEADNRAVKDRDRLAAGPLVSRLVQSSTRWAKMRVTFMRC